VRLSSFVLAAVVLGASGSHVVVAADRPPQDLHLVGDHWTAWDPPQLPAGAQVHVIERGDTLWDLAAKTYGNPYLWPQIWEKNQYILDAHWIYPGDPLAMGLEVAPVDTLSGGGTGTGTEAAEGTEEGEEENAAPQITGDVLTPEQAASAPIPLGAESDIYCSGYIGGLDEKFDFTIIGSEYESLGPDLDLGKSIGFRSKYGRVGIVKYNLSTGDIVYLNGGRARGMTPGTVFTVVEPERPVVHPVTRHVAGRFYHYVGRIRVLSVQEDTAIGEIVHSCDPILVGQQLQAFEPEPVPLGRPSALRPLNYPSTEEELRGSPVILFSQDNLVSLAVDNLVYIDRGADQEVTPGDMYTIYRLNHDGLPPVVIGELAVLAVHKTSSVAKIIESRYAVFVGDLLEAK
jgi:hypothetical protein